MSKKRIKKGSTAKISSQALRQFADNRRIFNKAVEKAIEENIKAGIPEDQLYAH
jgi:hypothetical protein